MIPVMFYVFGSHAGLVCLCGHAIDEDLTCNIGQNNILDLDSWIVYCSNEIQNRIIQYPTFTKMVSTIVVRRNGHRTFRADQQGVVKHSKILVIDIEISYEKISLKH